VDGQAASCSTCGCTLQITATVLPTNAELLQKGHTLRLPSGQRVKVNGIRPHENSGGHVYLDTDIGTSVVNRKSQFQVVQGDAASRGAPFKQPTNRETPGNFNTGLGESTEKQKAPAAAGRCPNCGKGPLVNHGGKMQCRNCGYSSSGGDSDFGESGYRRPTTAYAHDGLSAIARRAQTLVERTEQ
jgi:ribosomal protein S27AE